MWATSPISRTARIAASVGATAEYTKSAPDMSRTTTQRWTPYPGICIAARPLSGKGCPMAEDRNPHGCSMRYTPPPTSRVTVLRDRKGGSNEGKASSEEEEAKEEESREEEEAEEEESREEEEEARRGGRRGARRRGQLRREHSRDGSARVVVGEAILVRGARTLHDDDDARMVVVPPPPAFRSVELLLSSRHDTWLFLFCST